MTRSPWVPGGSYNAAMGACAKLSRRLRGAGLYALTLQDRRRKATDLLPTRSNPRRSLGRSSSTRTRSIPRRDALPHSRQRTLPPLAETEIASAQKALCMHCAQVCRTRETHCRQPNLTPWSDFEEVSDRLDASALADPSPTYYHSSDFTVLMRICQLAQGRQSRCRCIRKIAGPRRTAGDRPISFGNFTEKALCGRHAMSWRRAGTGAREAPRCDEHPISSDSLNRFTRGSRI